MVTYQKKKTEEPREDPITESLKRILSLKTLKKILSLMALKRTLSLRTLILFAREGQQCASPSCFFDPCILIGRALKLTLSGYSSNFILNM